MKEIISIIGLGYVGLPLAYAFAQAKYKVYGYDISETRVNNLTKGIDVTKELSKRKLKNRNLTFSNNIKDIKNANFHIIAVPTPIDKKNIPDLTLLIRATQEIGKVLNKGNVVVFESTVYPGLTEEVCIPLLEKFSGLKSTSEFAVGYSPERINPGDKKYTIENVTKIVSAQDSKSLDKIASVYKKIIKAGVYKAPSIKVAESAKVIENAQRDLNIALINELSIIFHKLGIDTNDVLDAASSKWNFHKFYPGLVGGHCIGVDPYYLIYKAKKIGINAKILTAGRKTNNKMVQFVVKELQGWIKSKSLSRSNTKIAIFGLSFKENVPDIRNSKAIELALELKNRKYLVDFFDPMVNSNELKQAYNLNLLNHESCKKRYDIIILAVSHTIYKLGSWKLIEPLFNKSGGILMDVKSIMPRHRKPRKIELWRL